MVVGWIDQGMYDAQGAVAWTVSLVSFPFVAVPAYLVLVTAGAADVPPRRVMEIPTLATIVAFAILVSLGAWQWKRMHWKRGLLDRLEAAATAADNQAATVVTATAVTATAHSSSFSMSSRGLPVTFS